MPQITIIVLSACILSYCIKLSCAWCILPGPSQPNPTMPNILPPMPTSDQCYLVQPLSTGQQASCREGAFLGSYNQPVVLSGAPVVVQGGSGYLYCIGGSNSNAGGCPLLATTSSGQPVSFCTQAVIDDIAQGLDNAGLTGSTGVGQQQPTNTNGGAATSETGASGNINNLGLPTAITQQRTGTPQVNGQPSGLTATKNGGKSRPDGTNCPCCTDACCAGGPVATKLPGTQQSCCARSVGTDTKSGLDLCTDNSVTCLARACDNTRGCGIEC